MPGGGHRPAPYRLEVEVHLGVPAVVGRAGQIAGRGVRQAAGVVHPDVDAAEVGGHGFGQLVEFARGGDVDHIALRPAAEAADLGGNRIDVLTGSRRHRHVGARLGEADRDAAAYALAAAGHHGHLAIQPEQIEHRHGKILRTLAGPTRAPPVHRLELSGLGANETVTAACYFRDDGEVDRE